MAKYLWVFTLVIALAVIIGCAPAATPAPAATSAPAATKPVAGNAKLTDGKIVIGVINDQSGVYADLSGKNSVEAAKMAVEDFKAKYGDNALGGSIEVITADHQKK